LIRRDNPPPRAAEGVAEIDAGTTTRELSGGVTLRESKRHTTRRRLDARGPRAGDDDAADDRRVTANVEFARSPGPACGRTTQSRFRRK
jgi:hypothetical protein